VRAAVAARAPRRTVAAAAAVASTMAALHGGNGARDGTTEPSAASERRRKKNKRKKERRKTARASESQAALHEATAAGNAPSQGAGEHSDLPAAAGPVATPNEELESAPAAVTPPLQPEPLQPEEQLAQLAPTTAPRVTRRSFAILGLEAPSEFSQSACDTSDSGTSAHSKRPQPDVRPTRRFLQLAPGSTLQMAMPSRQEAGGHPDPDSGLSGVNERRCPPHLAPPLWQWRPATLFDNEFIKETCRSAAVALATSATHRSSCPM
jgi:hypothetical protein